MNTDNNVVDVSPFLLIEATADSETHHDNIPNARDDDDDDDDDDNDDAESCRAGSSCVTTTSEVTGSGFDPETIQAKVDEEEGEEEGEVNSYGKWGRRENRNLGVDLSATGNERVSEVERSRLFWEACLAS